MAIFVTSPSTPYFRAGQLSSPKWGAVMGSGVLDAQALASAARVGDTIDIPVAARIAAFTRADITQTSNASPTAFATYDGKAVVLRDYSLNSNFRHDNIRSGEDIPAHILSSAGDLAGKNYMTVLGNMLLGAIGALDVPSTNSHILDITGATFSAGALTVQRIRRGQKLMGDNYDQLNTLLLDMNVWSDLRRDLIANYKIDSIAGTVINNGDLQDIMGLSNIIVSDDMPTTSYGVSSSGDNQHHSFMLAPGSVYWAEQVGQTVEVDSNILTPSTTQYLKVSYDFVLSLKGLKWAGSTNPANSALATASNWDDASVQNHQDVGAVMITSRGGVYNAVD